MNDPDLVRVTRYTVGKIGDERRHRTINVERTHEVDNTWAIRRHGECWTRGGVWEYEPMPSSRDDAFLARARFGEQEAKDLALAIWAGENAFTEEP